MKYVLRVKNLGLRNNTRIPGEICTMKYQRWLFLGVGYFHLYVFLQFLNYFVIFISFIMNWEISKVALK